MFLDVALRGVKITAFHLLRKDLKVGVYYYIRVSYLPVVVLKSQLDIPIFWHIHQQSRLSETASPRFLCLELVLSGVAMLTDMLL